MSDSDKSSLHSWTPPTVEELREMLPEYEISELCGQGGMGAVYKGRQKSLKRDVAIKILRENLAEGDSASDPHRYVERFKLDSACLVDKDVDRQGALFGQSQRLEPGCQGRWVLESRGRRGAWMGLAELGHHLG